MTLQRRVPKIEVFVDGRLFAIMRPVSCAFGAGSSGLPEAIVETEPMARVRGRSELLNITLAEFEQSEIEIVVDGRVVHWGKLLANQAVMNEGGDAILLKSRIEPHHFGAPVHGYRCWNPIRRTVQTLDLPIVFNPLSRDHKVVPNMSRRTGPAGERLFIHEESQHTDTAKKYAGAPDPEFWTLPRAVQYLCETNNKGIFPAAARITNPPFVELAAILPDGEDVLRNHEVRLGQTLPEALDDLLRPYGYDWTVTFAARGSRKITVFKPGAGPARMLRHQPPGAVADVEKTNVEAINLTCDLSDKCFTAIQVYGDFKRYESTFELVRAWGPEHDAADSYTLSKNDDGWFDDPTLSRAWRDWVLNEAGDYNGTRPGITEAYDLDRVFDDDWVPRRRRFEACLSKQSDGSPQGHNGGVYVEWWDNTEAAWKPVDELNSEGRQVEILDRECGIRFDGAAIPLEIYNQGDYARVRVTASVESDTRLSVFKVGPEPYLSDYKQESIYAGSKFKHETRTDTSRFDGDVREIDDTESAEIFAEELAGRWNRCSINGTVTITGIDYDTSGIIGRTIQGIDGRRVDFRTTPTGNHPTIVGCKIRFDTQQTDIVLDTFRGERTL